MQSKNRPPQIIEYKGQSLIDNLGHLRQWGKGFRDEFLSERSRSRTREGRSNNKVRSRFEFALGGVVPLIDKGPDQALGENPR